MSEQVQGISRTQGVTGVIVTGIGGRVGSYFKCRDDICRRRGVFQGGTEGLKEKRRRGRQTGGEGVKNRSSGANNSGTDLGGLGAQEERK